MTMEDHDGQDGLTLCEAYRLSGGSEKLRNAVARQFSMTTDDADRRIRAGYVSVNGVQECGPNLHVENGDSISVRPDPVGPDWDALRNALRSLMRPLSEDSIIWMNGDFLGDLNVVVMTEIAAERDRREDS